MQLVIQSHGASLKDSEEQNRRAKSINGEIVSDSEFEIELGQECKEDVTKKRLAIKQEARRLRAKLIAEKRFLQRRKGKRVR